MSALWSLMTLGVWSAGCLLCVKLWALRQFEFEGNGLKEKRRDLKSTKQKKIVMDIVSELNRTDPSLYYLSTSEIALEVKNYIETSEQLVQGDKALVTDLSQRDVQMLLSLHWCLVHLLTEKGSTLSRASHDCLGYLSLDQACRVYKV